MANSSHISNDTFYINIEVFKCNSIKIVSVASDILNLLLRYFIPFIIFFIINILIIQHFRAQAKKLRCKKMNKGAKKFLTSIIIINMLFLILLLPGSISFILIYIQFIQSSSENLSYIMVNFFNLSLTISYLNNTAPFFTHLIFNKIFRIELIKFFKKIFRFEFNKISSTGSNRTINLT
jgi:hypothetical protein